MDDIDLPIRLHRSELGKQLDEACVEFFSQQPRHKFTEEERALLRELLSKPGWIRDILPPIKAESL